MMRVSPHVVTILSVVLFLVTKVTALEKVAANPPSTAVDQPAETITDTSTTSKSGKAGAASAGPEKAGPTDGAPSTVIEEDDELILEGGEEDLLDQDQVSPAARSSSKPAASKDTSAVPPAQAPDSMGIADKPAADSTVQDHASPSAPGVDTPVDPVTTSVEPVRIEKAKSVNFAKNLTEYRSPKLAMLLSLLVPGSGQLYSRQYWKVPMFAAVEVGVIAAGVSFTMKGNRKREAAHDFADAHFVMDSVRTYLEDLRDHIEGIDSTAKADEVIESLLLDSAYVYEGKTGNGLYTYLSNSQALVQGWDDCEPSFLDIKGASPGDTMRGQYGSYVLNDTAYYRVNHVAGGTGVRNVDEALLGYSENMIRYTDMISVANSHYRTAGVILSLLLVNHIASAIDAGISAKSHNDRLLGKESLWQRINVDQQYVNTGTESVPGITLSLRF